MENQQNNDQNKEKSIAYYSALVNAWIETKMEGDKSIISLSAGGIGLLVGLLSTVGIRYRWELILYVVAIILFIVSILLVLIVFRRNSKYIEDVIKYNKEYDRPLEILDKLIIYLFIIALVFSSAIGIITALNNYKGVKMKNTKDIAASFNKISLLNPQGTKSLNEIVNLKPNQDSNANTGSGQGEQQSSENNSAKK